MFTKEHYMKIAKLLKDFKLPATPIGEVIYEKLVDAFIELFDLDNPNFNQRAFMEAIYGKEDKK